MHRERRAVFPSFPAGNRHTLIEASLINGLTYSPERIKPPLATMALVKEVSNRLFDQFVTASIVALASSHSTCCVKSAGSVTSMTVSLLLRVRGAITRWAEALIIHHRIRLPARANAIVSSR